VTNAVLNYVDGDTVSTTFSPPELDGGLSVTSYSIETATTAFVSEQQEVKAACEIVNEVQVISTGTDISIFEEQLIYISTTYNRVDQAIVNEIQLIKCEATAGTFKFRFGNNMALIDSQSIAWDADASTIAAALNGMSNINSVNVTMQGGQTTACGPELAGFTIEFESCTDDIPFPRPLMQIGKAGLELNLGKGKSWETVVRAGEAPIQGHMYLSYKSSVTNAISTFATTSLELTTLVDAIRQELNLLDSVQSGTVSVTDETSLLLLERQAFDKLIRVSFSGVGGNLDAIEVAIPQQCTSNCHLIGSNVQLSIFSDGQETEADRGGSDSPSVQGNDIGGIFQLVYRGHTTVPIPFNAADSTMEDAIEGIPSILDVNVAREGPDVFNRYNWTVTFKEISGNYPFGTGNAFEFVPDNTGLTGNSSSVSVRTVTDGSDPLSGYFTLSYTNSSNYTETTGWILSDASSSEVEASLNALTILGTVTVTRYKQADGLKWTIVFDGCKRFSGTDICNDGNVNLLVADTSNVLCGSNVVTTSELVTGSSTVDTVIFSSMTDVAPYTVQVSAQEGAPTFVAIRAHSGEGYGLRMNPTPSSIIARNNEPGQPDPVYLISSSANPPSITV
jgi:hypothetical protein